MTAGELKLQPTLCHGLAEAIAASLRSHAVQKGVVLELAHGAEDAVARTDRRMLGTILSGLIRGAIDAASRGKVLVYVSRSALAGARTVEISIIELAASGEAPAQGRADRVRSLSAVRELAAQIGGQISVHVQAAEGSTTVLQIPEG